MPQHHQPSENIINRRAFLKQSLMLPGALLILSCGSPASNTASAVHTTPSPQAATTPQATISDILIVCGDGTPTPSQTEGPFYKPGSPGRTSLREPGLAGTPLTISGYVLSATCQLVAHAWLDFWQADSNGNYDNTGFRLRGQETERIVHPYHLFNMHGEWYLIAFDRFRQGVRQFALPRIRALHILAEETFEIDSAFSPEHYFGKSFQSEHGENIVEVALLFDAYQARYIRERAYHSSQQLEEQPDGSVIMRFNTGAISEVQRWIMGYGSHVRVLSPGSLAQSIISEFRAGLQQYDDSQ